MTSTFTIGDPRQPCEGIVSHLERLLQRARDGDISMIATALVYRDGKAGEIVSRVHEYAPLVGAVTRMQARLTWEMIARDEVQYARDA